MGKPAARITDMTAHGGTITGPGNPTVLIGKIPAVCMGDMHVCPMVTPAVPPIPHVGGPITLGSTGVFIGKKPAARMGDMAVCVGPPSSIILGNMTTLIGETGSGGQAGSAGSAASAKAAKIKGPKKIKPYPTRNFSETPEDNHYIECAFVDSAGNPLEGVSYVITDPDKQEIIGVSSSTGIIRYDGYPKTGSFDLQVAKIANPKWSNQSLQTSQTAALTVDVDGYEDGVEAAITIYAIINHNEQVPFRSIITKVSEKKIEEHWTLTTSDIDTILANEPREITGIQFSVSIENQICVSPITSITSDYKATLKDTDNHILPNQEVEITFPGGVMKRTKTNEEGKLYIKDAPVGVAQVKVLLAPKY